MQVGLLLFPLRPLLFERKQLFGLLSLCERALAVQILQLLLVVVALLVELSLELGVSGIPFGLNSIDLFLETLLSFEGFLQALLQGALLSHLRFVEQFVLLQETLLLPLKLLVTCLQFNNLGLGSFLDFLEQLLLFVLQLHELQLVSIFELLL